MTLWPRKTGTVPAQVVETPGVRVVRLVGQVVRVSVETVQMVAGPAGQVECLFL